MSDRATVHPPIPVTSSRRTVVFASTIVIVLACAVLVQPRAGIAAATVETFDLSYGDVVSDGVPAAGAGNLEIGEATDSYRFTAAPGDEVILDALAGGAGTFRWTVTSPTGTVLVDHGLYVDRRFEVVESGTYTADVSGATAATTGTYSFQLLVAPPAEEFEIDLGDVVSDGVPGPGAGNIEVPGARDIYRFDATAGQRLVVDHVAGSNVMLGWQLAAPDGTVLFDTFLGDQQLDAPQTGVYTLTVRGNAVDRVGTYSFQLLVAPPADVFEIDLGDVVSDGVPDQGAGNVEIPGARDIYRFDATAGQAIILDHLTGSNVTLGWQLAAPDGTVLFDTFLADQQLDAPQTGVYTLTVRGNGVDDIGTYSFQLLADPMVDVFAISFDDIVTDGVPGPGAGNVETPGGRDVYTFDAAIGQAIVLDHITGSNVMLGWQLTAPDGIVLFDTVLADQQLDAPQTGVYILTVRGNGVDDIGTYSFQLLDVPLNSAPTIDMIDDRADTEGDAVDLAITADDPDGDPLTISATGLPAGVTIDIDRLTGTLATGTGAASPYTVEVTATDPDGATATTTFRWTIDPLNSPPVAVDDDTRTAFEVAVVIDVLANDTDPDGDPLTIRSASSPAQGDTTLDAGGVRYTPAIGFAGSDSFTYVADDGRGGTAEATVTVDVSPPPNSAPTIDLIDDRADTEGDAVDLAITADDPDGDPLTISATGLPAGVTIDIDRLTGTLATGTGAASPYTVEVTATDPDGATATTTFRWVVDEPDQPDEPVIEAEVDVVAPLWCLGRWPSGFVVIIHGSAVLPAQSIDVGSVRLAGMPVQRLFGVPLAGRADVDHDGTDDLVALIHDRGGIPAGAAQAIVTGQLLDGTPFAGTDTICDGW